MPRKPWQERGWGGAKFALLTLAVLLDLQRATAAAGQMEAQSERTVRKFSKARRRQGSRGQPRTTSVMVACHAVPFTERSHTHS